MILGTAGHIDHGKTTLVRALTGVDTDRLKEEKARGISIELGYAYMPVPPAEALSVGTGAEASDPAQVLGIIDVPGHEKFVHTMAAGASGIDHALLVVAADDGVMPQTREHLAIALLFGIRQGTVALTKCDRVDASRIAEVKAEVAALLASTPLVGSPVFQTAIAPADAEAGAPLQGVAELREHLFGLTRQQHARRKDGLFRLAVDRVFTLTGQGTVVTGTVFGGRVSVGDTVMHSATGQTVRVRSLHAQNRAAQQGLAGQRVALNLAGIDKQVIARGDWMADARLLQPSTRIDVQLRLLEEATPLNAWAPLHVHLGAAHTQAHAVPLQADTVLPGTESRVQLVFDAPVFVVPGDRFIVRNAQGTRTVGGGTVLDPQAPERRRRSAERMQWLDAMSTLVAEGDARPLLAVAPAGLTLSALTRLLGRVPEPEWAGEEVPVFALGAAGVSGAAGAEGGNDPRKAHALAAGTVAAPVVLPSRTDVLWLSPLVWAQVRERVLGALERHHARAPDEPGLNSARLQRMAFPASSANVQAAGSQSAALSRLSASAGLPGWSAWLAQLQEEGALGRTGHWLHLPGHSVSLSDVERMLAKRLLPLLQEGGNDPPWVRDLAQSTQTREDVVRDLLRKLARAGELYPVVKDLFYPAATVAALAQTVADLAQAATPSAVGSTDQGSVAMRSRASREGHWPSGAVEARQFRDAVQLGRKRAIQILEFFDRVGYTRRVGDAHWVRPHTRWTAHGPLTESPHEGLGDPTHSPAPKAAGR